MDRMRQVRTMPSRRRLLAGCVFLCLANLLAGCSDETAGPSTPPASTRQAEPQQTTGNERQETNETKRGAPTVSEQQQSTRTEHSQTSGTERRPAPPAQPAGDPGAEGASLYALQPTLRCLERRPRLATSTAATTRRLQALRDLAQRTSVIAELEGENVGIAVVQSSAHASLLSELLRAPEDPYRIIRRRNAVLLFLPRARDVFDVVVGCLRPTG